MRRTITIQGIDPDISVNGRPPVGVTEREQLSYESACKTFLSGCSNGGPGECRECLDAFVAAIRRIEG